MRFVTFCVLVTISCWVAMSQPSTAQRGKTGGAAASSALFQTMQATGKPALIIAGSTGCVYCVEMSQELSSNPKLQPLVQQMFVVKIDVESRDWPILRDTFKFDESGIPAVFFVRADGELLYSDSGKPTDMEGFLKRYLEKSGKLLDDKTLRLLTRDARQLDLALKRDDFEKAAELVQEHSGTGSFAAAALAFDKAGAWLVEQASTRSKDAVSRLTQPEEQMAAALDLLGLESKLASYEAARKVVSAVISESRQEDPSKTLIDDASQLTEPRKLEAAKRWKEAVIGYADAEKKLKTDAGRGYAAERVRLLQPRVKN